MRLSRTTHAVLVGVVLLLIGASPNAKAGTVYDLTTAEDSNSANSNPQGAWAFLAGTQILPFHSSIRGGAKITSQIRSNCIVPSRKYFARGEAE
jgi:hypothetical protein